MIERLEINQPINDRAVRPCQRKIRIELNGLGECLRRVLSVLRAKALVLGVKPAEISVVGRGVVGRSHRQSFSPRRSACIERFRDRAGDFTLDREIIVELPVVALRPQICSSVAARINFT